jgi:hypothetical protein
MKTLFVLSSLAVCLLYTAPAASSEWIGGMVSTDTLYPGKVNVIQMNAGEYQIETLEARLNAHNCVEFPVRCQACYIDTIWAADIQPYNDTMVTLTFDIPASAFPGKWYLDLNNSGMYYYPMLMFTRTYILSQPRDVTVCLGGTASIDICAYGYSNLKYEWFHNGQSLQQGYSMDSLVVENVNLADTGSYYCMMRDWSGEWTGSDTVHLRLTKMPEERGIPEGPTKLGYSEDPIIYEIRHDELITGYNWVLLPATAGTIESIEDSVIAVTWDRDFKGTAGLFVETTLGECPGLNSDTLWINVAGIPDAQEICIVGIDETIEKCRIVWNKSADPAVASYKIYRESNEAGIFLPLAEIPASGPSVFIDSTSLPEIFPHSYHMTKVDTNGTESDPGKIHKTILLSSSLGTNSVHNLNWTHYIGYPFLTYEIYHGPSRDSMTYMTSVASSVNAFIVQDPLPGVVNYQIVARREGCNPVLKSEIDYGETRSNVEQLITHSESPSGKPSILEIRPNPASRTVRIFYTGTRGLSSELTLVDLVGKVCRSYPMENEQVEIDVSDLAPGVYLVHLKGSETSIIRKLVIKRQAD